MRVGLSAYDMPIDELVDCAAAADELGFSSLWLGEHIVATAGYRSSHPTQDGRADLTPTRRIVEPDTALLDPFVALSAVAASTKRLEVATGIYLLALRHPLLTARAGCSVHDLSRGRFVLGVGSGWLEEEFEALGVPFASRVSRLEESIGILRAAWSGGYFSYTGRHYALRSLQVSPRPCPIPLFLGGNSEPALERAARLGDGWLSSGTPTPTDALGVTRPAADAARSGGWRPSVAMHLADVRL